MVVRRDIKWLYRIFNRLNNRYFNGVLPPIKIRIIDGLSDKAPHFGNRALAMAAFLDSNETKDNGCEIWLDKYCLLQHPIFKHYYPVCCVIGHEMVHYELFLNGDDNSEGSPKFQDRIAELGFTEYALF
jgi:hypothetical protein